ncbi:MULTISPECIES: hypothetical protein [Streptomyces]|uniref:hypothetical protein n=1 Tax=Streptomyces TaxID=1883 RepID=UPI00163C946A|nr:MULTISPECIES: hypothetical protein [Streptomyces]MBC2877839.1 hypothetical protein [Streptomyces sp. TYQ1024]UBI37977.1 hypothetical protein K7I03_16865 [Streptomyces mobaraensis]UKW30565.1 hypothetical protein MCU78_16825 [Streptomyces sp. TYQ1024]
MFGGRRGAAVALGSLALVVSSVVSAPAGHAGDGRHGDHGKHGDHGDHGGSVSCEGPSESTYDPPLALQPRTTRVRTTAEYTCTQASGRELPATGFLEALSPDASCTTLNSPRAMEKVRYADGKWSVVSYDHGSAVRVAGILTVTLTGRVVKGRGEGQPARRSVLLALPRQLPTECLSSGIRGNSGDARLEIGS